MARARRRGFARLAKRFAHLAPLPSAPALSALPPPLPGGHAEVGAEGPREGGGRGEAVIERDLQDGWTRPRREDARRLLDALPLDVGGERLARDGPEDAVEVERGEGGLAAELGEAQRLAQPLTDMVDDAIDALLVFEPGGVRPVII
jgi:hypothetical protein